jgi:hypothetical protein
MEIRSSVDGPNTGLDQVSCQMLFSLSSLPSHHHQCFCYSWVSPTRNVWDQKYFGPQFCFVCKFLNICIYIMRYLGDPSLNSEVMCISYPSCTHSLKVILCNSYDLVDFDPSHVVKCGIFHLWCHVNTQKVSNFGEFQGSDLQLGILNLCCYSN